MKGTALAALAVALAGVAAACAAEAPKPAATPAPSSAAATAPSTASTPASSTCVAVRPAACGAAPPTYARDVLPILEKRCFSCHAKDGVAADEHDFSKFAVASAQKKRIEGAMSECAMPPKSRPPLGEDDRRTLLTWVACGGLEK